MKQKFDITGMTCSACSSRVEKSVEKLPGIQAVSVNLLTNSMQVEYDENNLNQGQIVNTVEKAGYGAFVVGGEAEKPKENPALQQIAHMKTRLISSFCFLIPLLYISMGSMWGAPIPSFLSGHENAIAFAFVQFLLCLPVVYINRAYFEKGFSTLWHRAPNMDSLIAVGSSAALIYGIFAIFRIGWGFGHGDMALVMKYHMDLYFESAATILTLITLGKYLEAKSKGKTSEALSKLLNLAPKTALVQRQDLQVEVPIEQVQVGDIVIVKPGMAIPVDGIITEGVSAVDQAAITGESIPVHREVGDTVIGATINQTGYLKLKATKVGDDTTFSQIIKLVEEASASKAPIAQTADKIAGIFVPVVMGISAVTFVVWLTLGAGFEFALSSAITVLVISCPCALGLATPVAIMVGTGKGAENGILIKSGEALEIAHNVDTVVLDKTGTITKGKPVVTDILPFGISEQELLQVAAALEGKSEHPLAQAVVEYSAEKAILPKEAEDFKAVPGKGVQALINNEKYFAGNLLFLKENGLDLGQNQQIADQLADSGKTPLFFAKDRSLLGIIAVADVVKPTSKTAIRQLRNMGVQVIMLTGDNERTANGIAKGLDLSATIAQVLPADKEKVISDLQTHGKVVAMVGDGVNDAPALVRADVGIAIGAGTDVAVESADIVLMKNDLLDVANAIKLSKAVIKNIKQNLFWAFFYNCLGIPLAAGVFYGLLNWRLTPTFGAAAMSFSSLFVVSNALRLKLFKTYKAPEETITEENNNAIKAEIQPKYIEKKENNMILKIDGMMCGHCVMHVEKALKGVEGVSDVTVSLEDKQAKVTATGDKKPQLVKAVEDAGYTVSEIVEG